MISSLRGGVSVISVVLPIVVPSITASSGVVALPRGEFECLEESLTSLGELSCHLPFEMGFVGLFFPFLEHPRGFSSGIKGRGVNDGASESLRHSMFECYDPEPLPQFSAIFYHFISHSWSLVLHSFPHMPLRPSPNHLTSHLMDHLTIPQSIITCHHSTVRSIPPCHPLTPFDLPAHDGLFLDCQLMMEPYLEPPHHDLPYIIFPYFSVTSVTCDSSLCI